MSAPRIAFGITTGVGAASYFRGLFSHLRSDGFMVTFLAQDEAGAREFAVGEGADFIPIVAERNPHLFKDVYTLAQLYRELKRGKFDIAVWGTPKVGLLGCIASRASRTRSVYVIHGLRYQGAEGVSRRVLQSLEKITIALANEVVAVGAEIAECVVSDRVAKTPPRLIWNGSANGVEAPDAVDREGAKQLLGVADAAFVVGFVGRVTGDKGILELLTAWRGFSRDKPDALLVVAGAREPDSYRGELASEIGSAQQVHWLGHYENPTDVYSAIDVLVLPSKREGLPAVVMEASAHGKPVITSNRPGVGEAVIDSVTGFVVDCGVSESLVARLNQLYGDGKLTERLGDNGRKHILRRYDRRVLHAKWSEFLKSAVEHSS